MSQDNVTDLHGPEQPTEAGEPAGQREMPSRLRDAIRKARQHEAERSDVIVDLREAEIARLELLQEALADVFDAIPPDNDLLECALSQGNPPRLWIDVLAYVAMGRDKRTYRFIKDTRYGRQVVLETTQLEEIAARVTDYVAHRLLERERALESDVERAAPRPAPDAADSEPPAPPRRTGLGWAALISTFALGLVIGAVALFAGALFIVSL